MNGLLMLQNILLNIAVILGIISISILPFVYIFVGRSFDKLFSNKRDKFAFFHPGVPIVNSIMHCSAYATCIVFMNQTKKIKKFKPYLYQFFDYYDFRANASQIQIILSTIYLVSGLGCAIFTVLTILPNVINTFYNYLN